MDERSERVQRRFDLPVMVAALLTIPLIVIEKSDYGSIASIVVFSEGGPNDEKQMHCCRRLRLTWRPPPL